MFLNPNVSFCPHPTGKQCVKHGGMKGTMNACKLILRANRSGGRQRQQPAMRIAQSVSSVVGGAKEEGKQNCTRALTQPRVKMTVRADKTPRLSDGVRTRGGVVKLSKTLDLLQILAFMPRSFRTRLNSIWFGLGPILSLFS